MHNLTSNLPLVRLSSVNPFLLELERRNLDGAAILRKKGLPGQLPVSADLFASAATIYEIVEEAAAVADDPQFGYQLGKDLDTGAWDPMAKATAEAITVGDLLQLFVVNALDHSTSARFYLRTEGDRTTFGFERVIESIFLMAQNDAFYLGIFSRLLRRALLEHWDPSMVLATVADPSVVPNDSELPRLVRGNKVGFAISFPTEWQFESIEKSAFQNNKSFTLTNKLPESLIEAVRMALTPHLHESDLSVERAASICGYNKRQLSRKLRDQGTTIVKEVAALRAECAREKLTQSEMRIAEIGESVGFKDPTVFSRAFKSWTGESPQAYRRKNKF